MGQEVSTFKSILKQKVKIMDDNSILYIANENSYRNSCFNNFSNDSNNLPYNNNESPQHFENIYNISSEQIHVNESHDNKIETFDDQTVESRVEIKLNDNVMKDKSKYKSRKKHNPDFNSHSKKKKNHWVLKFNCARLKSGSSANSNNYSETVITDKYKDNDSCICTRYHRTENPSRVFDDVSPNLLSSSSKQHEEQSDISQLPMKSKNLESIEEGETSRSDNESNSVSLNVEPIIDLSKFNPEDYPIEDCDERARLERAREIAEGVEPPPGFSPHQIELVCHSDISISTIDNLTALFQSALSLSALSQIDIPKSVHTQIDYIHCLVPDLLQITSSSFYWGKIDRYEAEKVLENKPEGTFLLRDSAQEEYLFSVSFRKYNRSLHARIEQWNHKFSFDSHDPGVFASNTVCGLLEHYKDPNCVMFFEPMLTIPLHRNFPFSLQHICRATICDHLNYDSINLLKLPKALKAYLKEYHYKQRVRVRKFDSDP